MPDLFKPLNMEVERKYEGLAIALQSHIKHDYIPEGWRKNSPIGTVFGYTHISGQAAKDFLDAYQESEGKLQKTLENNEDERFRKYPCFRAAVRDFFEQGKHRGFVPKV